MEQMKKRDLLYSLLGKFIGSFIIFWLIYVATDMLIVLSALSPNGEKDNLLVRLMGVIDRFGGMLTGLSYYKPSVYRAATAYAVIFAAYKTIKLYRRENQELSHEEK